MKIAPALLEIWLRDYYFNTSIDLGCSGVENFTYGELRRMTGLTEADLDGVLFCDSQSFGAPGLRAAIANRWAEGEADRVMVTHGSSEAMYLLMHALLKEGDEVIVVDPAYQPLFSIAESIGCQIKQWKLRFEQGFVPDVEEFKSLITPRTRMAIINFPHNPTGATLTREQQADLISAVERVGAYLVWDGAFTNLVYDQPPLPDPALSYERAISLGTLSKAYGLPGLRVGWCVSSTEVLDRCVHLRDYITLYMSPLIEVIARAAIENADRILDMRLGQATVNLGVLRDWVARHEDFVEWVQPRGGVSAFPRFREVNDIEEFCHELARRYSVLLVPGTCFNHQGFARLGFGGSTSELETGLSQVSALLKSRDYRRMAALGRAMSKTLGDSLIGEGESQRHEAIP